MCTLLTVNRKLITSTVEIANAIVHRMREDAMVNSDGFNLILCGEKDTHAMNVQLMSIDSVLAILDSVEWTRMWLHSRMSTTDVKGVQGCHGFRTYEGWLVQHNGVITAGTATRLPVDSMVIADILATHCVEDTVAWLHTNASYANVFLVNPDNGEWVMSRSIQGSLYTDGLGNFSSHPIKEAGITTLVPNFSVEYLTEDVADTTVKTWPRYYSPLWDKDTTDADFYGHRYYPNTDKNFGEVESKMEYKKSYESSYELTEGEETDEEIQDSLRKLEKAYTASENDSADLMELKIQASLEGWDVVPYPIWQKLTKRERKELRNFIRRTA